MSVGLCTACNRERVLHAKRLCDGCYTRQWKSKNPERAYELAMRHREKIKADPLLVRRYRRTHYQNKIETIKARSKMNRHRNKVHRINALGGKCVCCGEKNIEFLSIDHIHGGGNRHVQSIGGVHSFYQLIKREGYPRDKYRVLCMNCQFGYRMGVCPHERERMGKSVQKLECGQMVAF